MTGNNAIAYKRKPFQQLTFTDDFMFRMVLMNDTDLCKRLIELLLDVEIDHIVFKQDEYPIAYNSDIKSIRLDVYLKDEEGTVFDLELQNGSHENLPKRSRYYQGLIDRKNLLSGKRYEDLPDSYIIFICTFDSHGRGLHKYEFRELCVDDPDIGLGDGTTKVFINAKGKREGVSEEMRAFLDYLCGMEASSDLTRDIDAGVAHAKASRSLEEEYMTFGEELERVEIKAREEGRFEAIDKIIQSGLADEAHACETIGVKQEDFRRWKEAR